MAGKGHLVREEPENVVCMEGMQERNVKQDMVVVLDSHKFSFGDTDVFGQVGDSIGKCEIRG